MSQIVTGEAVTVDLREARAGSRVVAAIVDLVAQVLLALLIWLLVLRVLLVRADTALVTTVALLTYVVVVLGYPVAFESLWRGRTPGKAAMGLRVVRDDGGPIRFRHAFVRGLVGVFERPGPLFGAPALICMLINRRSKRIGDVLAGTVVLQERVPTPPPYAATMPAPLAGWAATLDLSGLSDQLALSARQFLGRAGQLLPEARERLGRDLVDQVQRVVVPPPPPGTPGWAYLAAVLAERRRRDEERLGFAPGAGAPGWGSPPPPRTGSGGWGGPPATTAPGWSGTPGAGTAAPGGHGAGGIDGWGPPPAQPPPREQSDGTAWEPPDSAAPPPARPPVADPPREEEPAASPTPAPGPFVPPA